MYNNERYGTSLLSLYNCPVMWWLYVACVAIGTTSFNMITKYLYE